MPKKYVAAIFVIFLLTSCQTPKVGRNSDFLWETVSQNCVPNQKAQGQPEPCAEVTFEKDGKRGYVVFKDHNGPLQYLLMPTTKVVGIESPEVLKDDSPNYFYQAWEARSHMEKIYKSTIPPEEISLALNSQIGRSQNQLHIHISCIRPDVKVRIQQNVALLGAVWAPFPGGILGHNYFSRRLTLQQLKEQNAFQLLANDLPEAKAHMRDFGLGIVPIKNATGGVDFVLLADRTDISQMDIGHVEEIQDHKCPQLYGK